MKFMEVQYVFGGGDYFEVVEVVMEVVFDLLQWCDDVSICLLFLVLDVFFYQEEENRKCMQVVVIKVVMQGIQIILVSCSGVDKSMEYFLCSMVLVMNGIYIFVMDYSGIGNVYIEFFIDFYEVEFLNDVLVCFIIECSQLVICSEFVVDVELL